MATDFLQRLAINDDVDAEFSYWKSQLVFTAWVGVGFGVAAAALIALWPAGIGDPELRDFARTIWVLLVEFAFWFGFLAGLLWGGAKRLGSALSGVLPWLPAQRLKPKDVQARFFGQMAAAFTLAGISLWLSHAVATPAAAALSGLLHVLASLAQACFVLAVVTATAALACRRTTLRSTSWQGRGD